MKAKGFSQLLAQIGQLLQTLLNLPLSLGDILSHSSFVFPDARRTLRLIELHLWWDKCQLMLTFCYSNNKQGLQFVAVKLIPVYLHVSRQQVHGFGSSRDIRHSLAIISDVEILNKDVVQNQFFKETVSIMPRVCSSHSVHSCLYLGRFRPYMGQFSERSYYIHHTRFALSKYLLLSR